MFKACIGFRSRRVEYLDKTHCSLARIPEEVYRNERWLEELILDMNMIQEFPPKFFRLVNLRRLSVSENDLLRLPVAIGNLVKLVELNLSKNSIEELPESLASCRSLAIVDFSMNPLMKPPEVLSSIPSLTQIMLNDVALQRLPMDIGNLENLVILEARENLLKLLPTSIGNLRKLKRLDLGNNEIEELPPHIGQLVELEELWLDINSLTTLPQEITQLASLAILDLTKNRLSILPTGLDHMTSLKDLIVSENFLESVPPTLGAMPNLYQLKLDMNRLFQLPDCFERLDTLEELFLYDNLLETLPTSIFKLKNLRLLNVDRNHLVELPREVAIPKLHVLSVRDNELTQLPDDIGNLSQLTVLDVCGNRLGCLPCSVQKLKLEALWLIDNQPQPLMQLHEEENAKGRLMCSLLPQKGPYNLSMENFLADSDADSNGQKDAIQNKDEKKDNAKGLSVAFDPSAGPPEDAPQGKLVRFPTPARRKGRNRDSSSNKKHKPNLKGDAPAAPSIFKKTKQEDAAAPSPVTPSAVDNKIKESTIESNKLRKESGVGDLSEVIENMRKSPSLIPNGGSLEASAGDVPDILPHVEEPPVDQDVTTAEGLQRPPSTVSFSSDTAENEGKRAQFHRKDTPFNLMGGNTAKQKQQQQQQQEEEQQQQKQQVGAIHSNSRPVQDSQARSESTHNSSTLQTVMVEVDLTKEAGRSLGFSIAGGRGSMPAYEDVDDGVFITKIAVGGLAEADGRLRLGDRLLSVNGTDMAGISHVDAVDVLKSITDHCHLVVSREVLIVLPEDITSPPPGGKADTGGEDQPDKAKTPPSTQSENVSSPPPDAQVIKTSPPPEDQANKVSPPPPDHTNTNTNNTLTVSSVVLSKSTEEMREFGDEMSRSATAAHEDEVVTQQVVEQLLEGAPQLEDQPSKNVENQQVEREDEMDDKVDDTRALEEFAEQLRKSKEEEREEITMHVSTNSSEPRDNYVNYDIAQAVIVTSPSNGSLANSETSTGSGDPPARESSEQLENSEVVESKPTATEPTITEPSVEEPPAKTQLEAKKSEPKVVAPVTEEVVLSQGSGPLGMNIVGGSDRSSFPFGKGLPGVFISKIAAGGTAATTGKLRVGDQIVKVNGEDTKGCTHQEVVNMLMKAATSETDTTLIVQHDPAPAGLMEIKLHKGPHEKLGISIRGGERGSHSTESEDEGISVKGYHGNPYDTEDEGIFISKVSPGGVAAQDGRLKVGQRILEVNGQSLVGASHVTAVRIMKDVQEDITLVVCNGFDPSSEEPFGSTASMHMIHGRPTLPSNASGQQSEEPPMLLPKVLQSPTIDVTVTEEKLDEMLKELEDINKSIASPSTSDDENDTQDVGHNTNLLSPDRKYLSKSLSTPLGDEGLADSSNLITTTSLSTGELNMATSEAIKSIHDEMDLLQQEVNKQAEEMLQSTRRRRNSKNSDYQWAELEKKRIEQTTQELRERTRATQEAARKKVEDTEKKVKEEAEKLAQQRKEEHDRRVQEAVNRIAQEQMLQSPAEHKEHLATMITEIFDHGNLQSDFDQFNEVSVPDDDDDLQASGSHDNMDDIVKALTNFSADDETHTGGDLEERDDIIKALTDFSASSDVDLTKTMDTDTLLTSTGDHSDEVTISYTQGSNTGSDSDEKLQPQKHSSEPPPALSTTVNSKPDTADSKQDDAISSKNEESQKTLPPPVVRRQQRGQKNNPERLSFIERLQLHEKAVKEEAEAAKRLPINRSSSATTINTNSSSLRALQKKFAASSDNLDDVEQPSLNSLKDTPPLATETQEKDDTHKASVVKAAPAKVTTSLAISSVKTRSEPVKTSTEPIRPSKEPIKTPAESSQNRYVKQILQNMPPPVTYDDGNADKSDDDDVDLDGLTPAQARVLQAQQRRVWRANKESELNDALGKAQAAIESAQEQQSTNITTTITVTHQQHKNDNC